MSILKYQVYFVNQKNYKIGNIFQKYFQLLVFLICLVWYPYCHNYAIW